MNTQSDNRTKTLGIIPSRYASSRFPGKPLADINGKSMVQRVYEQALKATLLTDVVVATDDERIADHVTSWKGNVVMTDKNHPSGTDRCREAADKFAPDADIVINIQGDEPFIAPEQINQLAQLFDKETDISTLVEEIDDPEVLFNENAPKVVRDLQGFALYFSRHPIPFRRGVGREKWMQEYTYFRHIGLYGYRMHVLRELTTLSPSLLEKSESLEQLRWLENGYKIKTGITKGSPQGIDTPEDLKKLLNKNF